MIDIEAFSPSDNVICQDQLGNRCLDLLATSYSFTSGLPLLEKIETESCSICVLDKNTDELGFRVDYLVPIGSDQLYKTYHQ